MYEDTKFGIVVPVWGFMTVDRLIIGLKWANSICCIEGVWRRDHIMPTDNDCRWTTAYGYSLSVLNSNLNCSLVSRAESFDNTLSYGFETGRMNLDAHTVVSRNGERPNVVDKGFNDLYFVGSINPLLRRASVLNLKSWSIGLIFGYRQH